MCRLWRGLLWSQAIRRAPRGAARRARGTEATPLPDLRRDAGCRVHALRVRALERGCEQRYEGKDSRKGGSGMRTLQISYAPHRRQAEVHASTARFKVV